MRLVDQLASGSCANLRDGGSSSEECSQRNHVSLDVSLEPPNGLRLNPRRPRIIPIIGTTTGRRDALQRSASPFTRRVMFRRTANLVSAA
jgi:hypothetical protein